MWGLVWLRETNGEASTTSVMGTDSCGVLCGLWCCVGVGVGENGHFGFVCGSSHEFNELIGVRSWDRWGVGVGAGGSVGYGQNKVTTLS